MKNEEQRIAIAEACGWTDMARTDKAGYYHGCLMGNHDYGHLQPVPDYLGDLNAMHEAEKVLTLDQQDSYAATLGEDALRRTHSVITYRSEWKDSAWHIVHANATQRAEAFLRTLNLWTE